MSVPAAGGVMGEARRAVASVGVELTETMGVCTPYAPLAGVPSV
jgi:hypothetical protein